jgi:hypothetical protein
MNKKQESRWNMYSTVHETLVEQAAIYAAHPALGTAVRLLGENLAAISVQVEHQVRGITGHARAKAAHASRLVDLSMVVSKATLAYATAQDDLVLAGRLTLTRRRLNAEADAVLGRHCKVVLDTAVALGAVLEPYGVDEALLDQLRAALRLNEEALNAPRHAIASRKSATSALADLMKATRTLVHLRIDGLMERYRLTDPAFHTAYRNARIIVDRGTRSAQAPQAKAA